MNDRFERIPGARFDARPEGISDGIEEAPVAELLKELAENGQVLVREELRLARLELKDEIRKAARPGLELGASGLFAHTAFLILAAALVLGLATLMPAWVAAFIVGALLAGAAAYFAFDARKRALTLKNVAPQTTQTMKENAEWARETMRAVKSKRHADACPRSPGSYPAAPRRCTSRPRLAPWPWSAPTSGVIGFGSG